MSGRLLITAGPTHEPIDQVRYLANRSSGRLGVCLAEAGQAVGWEVTLLLGPVASAAPTGMRVLRFESAGELEGLLGEEFPRCDVLIMAAAVADYRPRRADVAKLERAGGSLILELEPTSDLVAACAGQRRPEQRIVGFALEDPAELTRRARDKLVGKGLDAIVANPLETMSAEDIAAVVYTRGGEVLVPGEDGPAAEGDPRPIRLPKREFARWLIGVLDRLQ